MVIERGSIWWADLPEPTGASPGYRRPVVVIQANAFNQSQIDTVIVIALTSNLRLANAPGNLLLTKRQTGLPKDSVANVSQLYTIDKTNLTEQVGHVNMKHLHHLENGLRLILHL